MYNEERKEEFIKSYTSNSRTAYYTRKILEKFEYAEENEWHEDLCKQPKEQLEKIINAQTGTRMQSAERYLIVVRDYIKWCKRNGIETSDGVFEVKVNTVESVKKLMVGNPVQLQEKLNALFGTGNMDTIYCIYRAYIWMAYMGLTEEEALDVRKKDVKIGKQCIKYHTKIFKIPDEALEAFINASTLTEFVRNDCPLRTIIPRGKSDKLISGRNGAIKSISIRRAIGKREEATGVTVTYRKIFYSGLFQRIYLNELNGRGIDFSEYVTNLLSSGSYEFNQNRTYKKSYNERVRALEVDYDCWKCAFDK